MDSNIEVMADDKIIGRIICIPSLFADYRPASGLSEAGLFYMLTLVQPVKSVYKNVFRCPAGNDNPKYSVIVSKRSNFAVRIRRRPHSGGAARAGARRMSCREGRKKTCPYHDEIFK